MPKLEAERPAEFSGGYAVFSGQRRAAAVGAEAAVGDVKAQYVTPAGYKLVAVTLRSQLLLRVAAKAEAEGFRGVNAYAFAASGELKL